MELSHEFRVPVPVEQTWQAFNDLDRVAPCFPGATLTSAEGDSFSGGVKVKLGPISMQYAGTGTWQERDESARRAVIVARGKDKRGNGTASATVTAQLSVDGDGTAVSVHTELKVTGKPAQFGRGVMQDVSDRLLGQFVACLTEMLAEPADAAAAAGGEAAGGDAAGGDAADSTAGDAEGAAGADLDVANPRDGSDAGLDEEAATSIEPDRTDVPPVSDGPRPSGPGDAGPAPEAQLDLLATVLPVLARRYAAPALGVVAGLVVLRWLRRR